MGDAEKGRGTEKGLKEEVGGGPSEGREDGEGQLSEGGMGTDRLWGEPRGRGKIERRMGLGDWVKWEGIQGRRD